MEQVEEMMTAAKVGFLVSRLTRQGPVTHLLELLRQFPHELRAEVIALDDDSDNDIRRELSECGITFFSLADKSGLYAKARELHHLASTRGYLAIISSGIRADMVSLIFRRGPRRFVIKHEPAFTTYRGSKLLTILVRSSHLFLLARADSLICVSNWVKETLPAWLRRRSTVILNAVDTTYYREPSEAERAMARASMSVPNGERVVLFVGSLDERKRPKLLLGPVLALRAQGFPVGLYIAGAGPLLKELEGRGREGVRILGFESRVRNLYWAADVLALPSMQEGLPMVVLEAMASGVPVLLSDIPPHREILEEQGNAGSVVDFRDERKVTAALRSLLDRRAPGAPRTVAKRRFDSRRMSLEYARLITNGEQ